MEDKNKLARIYVPYGVGRKLTKVFGCTLQMVSVALAGKRNTELAKKIRHTALTQYGGTEIKKD